MTVLIPASRSAVNGLPTEAENVRVLVADLDAEPCRCGRTTHQPRERLVPCQRCRRLTADFHAICDACQTKEVRLN